PIRLLGTLPGDDDSGHGASAGIRLELHHLRVHHDGDVVMVEGGTDGDDLGVRLRVHQTWIAVAPGAPDARARGAPLLVQQDAARRGERVRPGRGQVVEQLLDPWLAGDGRPRVLAAPVALDRILPVRTMDLVQPFRPRVPG